MERFAALAASALRAPFAFVAFVGDDRRCFGAGRLPAWISHDPGLLTRSGLIERICAARGPISVEDAPTDAAPHQVDATRALEIAGVVGVALRLSSGECVGAFCVADGVPTVWTAEDVEMLAGLAATVSADIELRRELALREARERRLRHDARHDPLTGLANRTALLERLRTAVERGEAHRPGAGNGANGGPAETLVAVLFFDLDEFRVVNERLGHRVGDQVLSTLARRLEEQSPPGSTVARLGGDEFAVLLEGVPDPEGAEQEAERLRAALAAPISIGGQEVRVTVGAGLALSATLGDLPEHLLRSADVALARSKREARATGYAAPVLFDWHISAEARARRRLEEELHRAVRDGEFALHYLPTVSLVSGRIEGVEALLRWNHPTRGLVAPGDFLPAAEELELIHDISRWVMREACGQLREWTHSGIGPSLCLSVNLSPRQFASLAFVEELARTVMDCGVDPGRLAVEVTEKAVTRDVSRSAGTLVALRTLGVRIHLDDFGTGASSLSAVQRLPLDAIKIDHTLVSRMDRDEQALRAVRTLVGMARELGLGTVAEGVSAAEHRATLHALGCTHGQGPYFSSPVDRAGMERLLASGQVW